MLRVFISWSGGVSHRVALALREWLPQVIQAIDPFVSSKDIEKGDRWHSAIAKELAGCSEGLVVVTGDNKDRPWLNFEAGAISKQEEITRVRTLLFDTTSTEVTGPLSSFQSTNLKDFSDVSQLMLDLSRSSAPPLAEKVVEKALERSWPDLQASLAKIEPSETKQPARSTHDILVEMLERVRNMDQRVAYYGEQVARLSAGLQELQQISVPVVAAIESPATGSQVRVYELANGLGVESETVVAELLAMGEFVRGASSKVAPQLARRVAERLKERDRQQPETPQS